jgi:hypothetical protein
MSVALLVFAGFVALVGLVGPAALLAWGLAGGDGESRNQLHGLLAVVLVLAAVYTLGMSFAAFEGVGGTSWIVMWVAPMIAVGSLLLLTDEPVRDRLVALWIPTTLAIPPVLVLLAVPSSGSRGHGHRPP